jgi:hypothetical protein
MHAADTRVQVLALPWEGRSSTPLSRTPAATAGLTARGESDTAAKSAGRAQAPRAGLMDRSPYAAS